MLVVSRFTVPEEEAGGFRDRAQRALAALAARPGFVRGRVGRATDDPTEWVFVTEWAGVGAYRRSLSAYDVKVHAAPLLGQARLDEVSAFEVLLTEDTATASSRAVDADTVAVGEAARPAVPDDLDG